MRHSSDNRSILRKRVFQVRGLEEISEVVALARHENFTGTVSLHVGNGTCQAVTLEERANLSGSIPLTSKTE